jgi:4-amino-4-deoxy-L-arabinose transferase-like glycosyltransferase
MIKSAIKFSLDGIMTRLLKFGQQPGVLKVLPIVWLLLVGSLAFFWHLGSIGLIDETEPLFAEAARQMTVTGDWITPYFNGVPRFDKPPLIYWLMAIAYQTIGTNEWAARLPSAIAGFALTCFCFYTLSFLKAEGRRIKDEKSTSSIPHPSSFLLHPFTPFLAAAIVALNPHTLFFGRTGYSDMLLNACIGGALLSFFLGYMQSERRIQVRWYSAFYGLIALAILTKGPVGIVLPGLIIGAFLLYLGNFKAVLRELNVLRGLLIVLVISLPWYVLVTLRNGETYVNSFFGFHNFERFTQVVNDHAGPWYFHIAAFFIGFAPWSVFVPAAIAHFKPLQRKNWQQQPRIAHLPLFALLWFGVVLSFFTIAATKYFSYVLPLMPAAAILVALWWNDQVNQQTTGVSSSLKVNRFLILGFWVALAIACFYCPNWLQDEPSMPNLGIRVEQAGLPFIGMAIWASCAIVGVILWLQHRSQWLLAVNLAGFIAFLTLVIMPVGAIVDAERQLPLRQIAQTIVQTQRPNEAIVMPDDGFDKPSLVFYTQQNIWYVDKPAKTLRYLQNFFQERPNAQSVLLIASERAMKKTNLSVSQYEVLREAGIYQLVRVPEAGLR